MARTNMAAITVPEKDQKTLGELVNLSGDRLLAISAALKATKPALLVRQLAAQVSRTVGMPEPTVLPLIRLLATMYAVRVREELTVDEFVDQICAIIKKSDKPELQLSPHAEEEFKKHFRDLLSIDSLFVTAKALQVVFEHEHVLCEPRIITDMRPVFGINDEPAAAVAIHTLRLNFHEGLDEGRGQFFVAMTSDDIRQLKKLLERAELKEAKLKVAAANAGLLWLDSND